MLPAALWVTSVTDGRRGVRALLRRTFRWRIGLAWWAVVLLAIPLTTLALGVATGRSLHTSDLVGVLAGELVALIIAVVLANLWEGPSGPNSCRTGWKDATASWWRPR